MMNRFIPFLLCALISLQGLAQTRIFVVGGFSGTDGGNLSTYIAKHDPAPFLELDFERKIIGSVSFLTGLTYFGVGYQNESGIFGSASKFDANYLGVPLMMRWSLGNKNFFCLDLGFEPYYMLSANLQESITDSFGTVRTASGEISGYSNRFYLSGRIQETIMFNRFTISLVFMLPFHGQSSIKNLADHWALNQQQSTYLLSNGYADFMLYGVTIGFRLR